MKAAPCRSRSRARAMPAVFALAAALLVETGLAWAGGEDARRLAATLAVAADDIRLIESATRPAEQVPGLRDRVDEALGVLPWLLRLAGDRQGADRLRVVRAENRPLPAVRAVLSDLSARHPLDSNAFAPPRVPPRNIRTARAIHESYCAGCHDGVALDTPAERPAVDLFALAAQMPDRAFLARLMEGVRGNRVTGLANPLSDARLGGLAALYRGGRP